MTVSASLTASTIERPRPPDRARTAQARDIGTTARPSVAAVVTSLHSRTGKTLLARVLADYFVLSGRRPLVFDTDPAERTLHASFPSDTTVIDLADVRDQMVLFDTLAMRSPDARVVDVSHHVYRRFFRVMQESHFVAEARQRAVEPIIFYIADRKPDAYEEGVALRGRFATSGFVLVENAHVGRIKEQTRLSTGYQALMTHDLQMTLPLLPPELSDTLDESGLSLSAIVSQPLSRGENGPRRPDDLSFEDRMTLRNWLVAVFRDIHRLMREIETRAPPLVHDDALS